MINIKCNFTPSEFIQFAQTVSLINELSLGVINNNDSYFVRDERYGEGLYELRLIPKGNGRCDFTFVIDLAEKANSSIYWSCNGFRSIEEVTFDLDYSYSDHLYQFVRKILSSKITAKITLVNGKPMQGKYLFHYVDSLSETQKFSNGHVYFWNKTDKTTIHFYPWL